MRNRALIVVQDQSLHQEIVDSLQTTALEIDCAETYAQAISLYARFHYVLIILDLGIPDADGVTIVRRLQQLEQTPILALSAFDSREEEISVLNAGADGYIPIEEKLDQKLLLAHASALMRRYLSANTREYAAIQIAGIGLKINLNLRKAFLNGENLHLTPLQYSILTSLAEHLGEVVPKEELYQAAWPNDYDIQADASLKFQVKELRKKLRMHGVPEVIETIWGVGYLLCLEDNTRPG